MVGFSTLKRMIKKDTRRGFTLMEMLVVVSIITILVLIGLNSFSQNIKRARDTKRQAELEQIRGVLEMYRADHLSVGYPVDPATLVPTYISQMPTDALFKTPYFYIRTTATTYDLCAHLENGDQTVNNLCYSDVSRTTPANCGDATTIRNCNYRVTQP